MSSCRISVRGTSRTRHFSTSILTCFLTQGWVSYQGDFWEPCSSSGSTCTSIHLKLTLFHFAPVLSSSFILSQILEAVTMQHIFMNNFQLCSEISERVVQHFVHCTETHGRHVQYLKFLQTIVKAENKFIKKCQDIVMAEVCSLSSDFYTVKEKC